MLLNDNSSLLFIGDSITDCGRAYPIGEGNRLGNGYVALVDNFIKAVYPKLIIKIMNTGISGNRITDLKSRWKRDVLELNADRISIMIGINDVWHQVEDPFASNQVIKKLYRKIYRELIESVINEVEDIILITPYFLELDKNDPMRKMMDKYSNVVKELSLEYGTIFIDAQHSFDQYLKYYSQDTLSYDKVHPNLTGHMIIASSFLKAIGFDWK